MFSMMSAAVKVMQHQQQLENEDPANSDGSAQAEQLRLMLDAMWASNALDIQTTVARACQLVTPLKSAAFLTSAASLHVPCSWLPHHTLQLSTGVHRRPRFEEELMPSWSHFSCSDDEGACATQRSCTKEAQSWLH